MSGSKNDQYVVTLNASASFNGTDYPAFSLLVDGQQVASGLINSNSTESETFTVSLTPEQAHTLSVDFTNYDSSAQLLTVESIEVDGSAVPVSSALEQYVSTNGTYNSWGQMYFGGQINFALPATDFQATTSSNGDSGTDSGSGTGGGSETGGNSGTVGSSGSDSSGSSENPGTGISTPGGTTTTSSGSGSTGTTTPPSGGSLTSPDVIYVITTTASASFDGSNYPQFDLIVDGVQVGSGQVASNNAVTSTFNVLLAPGVAHDVQISYTNHASSAQMLNIQSVSINGQVVSSGSPGETYTSSNGVQQQTGQMYFGGSLDFSLGASYFPGSTATGSTNTGGTGNSNTSGTTGGTTGSFNGSTIGGGSDGDGSSVSPTGSAVYVSPTGSDSGDGSAAHPYATFQHALTEMEGRDAHTLDLENGTYTGQTIELTSADNGDMITAVPGQTAVLDGSNSRGTLVNLNGTSGVTLSSLTFENSAVTSGTATGAVTLTNASGSSITGNVFLNSGADALLMTDSTGNTVSGNQIDNSGQSGIEDKDGGSQNVFENNTIDGVGAQNTSGGGLYLHGTDHETISHNLVENTAGSGIALVGLGGYNGIPVYARNTYTSITDNLIQNTGKNSTDSGSIYVLDRTDQDTNILVNNNEVNGSGSGPYISGIYLDDYASGVTVTNNIVRGISARDMQLHGGHDDTFSNNILDLGNVTGFAMLFQAGESDITPAGGVQAATNNSFTHNILISTQMSPEAFVDLGLSPDPSVSDSLYYDPNGLFTAQQGTSSYFDNPQFSDAAAGNYSLQPGSAASQIGFTAINQAVIGLTKSNT